MIKINNQIYFDKEKQERRLKVAICELELFKSLERSVELNGKEKTVKIIAQILDKDYAEIDHNGLINHIYKIEENTRKILNCLNGGDT